MIDLKDSCPAVSQICSLRLSPSTCINLAPNSTPMVTSCFCRNRRSISCSNKQDLPTPKRIVKKIHTSVTDDYVFKQIIVGHYQKIIIYTLHNIGFSFLWGCWLCSSGLCSPRSSCGWLRGCSSSSCWLGRSGSSGSWLGSSGSAGCRLCSCSRLISRLWGCLSGVLCGFLFVCCVFFL